MQPEGDAFARSVDSERGPDHFVDGRDEHGPRYDGLGHEPSSERPGSSEFDNDARRAAAARRPRRTVDRRPSGPVYRGPSDRDEPVYRGEPSYRDGFDHRDGFDDRDEPVTRHPIEDYLGDGGREWAAEHTGQPPVIEYTDAVDEEDVWGPRPKLLPAVNGGRRTVVITGRGADNYAAPRAAGHQSAFEHARGFSADRTAMWAVLLCVIVLLVAITSH